MTSGGTYPLGWGGDETSGVAFSSHDNGKTGESRRRKATGLRLLCGDSCRLPKHSKTAELPMGSVNLVS